MSKTRFRLPGPDRYEFNARLRPAFLCALPALVVVAAWLPEVWTTLGGLTTLIAACGLTALMAQFARAQGRRLQSRLAHKLGPEVSAQMLSWKDHSFDPLTKARRHDFLREQGLPAPTAEEERADPNAALDAYRACTSWLVANTRDKSRFYLLAEENISYGFRRNLRALKPVALPVLVTALVANSWAMWFKWPDTSTQYWAAAGVEVGLLLGLLVWVWLITDGFVADASRSYATQLLAACDELGKGKPKRKDKKPPRSPE